MTFPRTCGTPSRASASSFGGIEVSERRSNSASRSISVVTAFLLGYKRELHAALEHLERHEVQASLQLLLIALVALPLLPDRNLGLTY